MRSDFSSNMAFGVVISMNEGSLQHVIDVKDLKFIACPLRLIYIIYESRYLEV